jgi:hypothetical protein
MNQHDAHVIRQRLAQALAAEEHSLEHDTNRSPGDYYDCKARVLRLRAQMAGTTPDKLDPMAWHYGFQSN